MFSRLSFKALLVSALCSTNSLSLAALQMETIAEGLDTPWSVAELPDGGFLVTERPGSIKRVAPSGEMTAVTGVPRSIRQTTGRAFRCCASPQLRCQQYCFSRLRRRFRRQ